MALVNRSFQLDVTPGAIPQVVKVSEYDENREYTVTLIDEGGVYEIPSGTTAKVEGSIGGNAFSESATVSGNTITFTLTESMTALAGDVWCKIKLTKDSKPIQTAAFILRCDRAGVEAGTVIGADGFQEQINEGVAAYFDGDPPFFTLPEGGQSGQALLSDGAGGAVWGQAQGGSGLTDEIKTALMNVVNHIGAWSDEHGAEYAQALYDALYSSKNLVSISAAFNQGSAVIYDTDSLDSLKQYLTVTATYDDSSTGVITNYTLSGTLAVGTSTITVSYGGKTATFNVTVAHAGLLPAEYQQVEYIANPSNAYIVTSIPIPLGYMLHGKAYLSAKPSQAVNVCGGDNKGTTTNWANVSFCCYSAATENYAGTFYGGTNCFDALADLYASPLEFSTILTANSISINLKNSGGEKSKTVSKSGIVAVDALNVFRASADAPNPFAGRIYLIEVLDTNNQATAKLIPCYRKADGVVGMYDTVNKAFYTSANSTAFTKGGDVA